MPMPTPTAAPQIQGSLPFGSGGANFDFSGNPATLSANYATAYNDALAQNKANYGNILSGYQQTAANQTTAQGAIAGGYTGLYNNLVDAGNATQAGYGKLSSDVLGTIQGVGASQQQAINDYYAQQQGQAGQSLVDRGLGNTTVANSVQRGLGLDQQKANIALSNQVAQLTAGYQSNLGLAGLNFRNQAALQQAGQGNLGLAYQAGAAQQNTGLAQNQLGFMERTNAPYPNAGLYGQLAQQFGASQQANADRAQAAQQLAQLQGAGNRTPAPAGGGYVPSGGGFAPPQSFGGGGYAFAPGGGGSPGGLGTQSPYFGGTPGATAYATGEDVNAYLDSFAQPDVATGEDVNAYLDSFGGDGSGDGFWSGLVGGNAQGTLDNWGYGGFTPDTTGSEYFGEGY